MSAEGFAVEQELLSCFRGCGCAQEAWNRLRIGVGGQIGKAGPAARAVDHSGLVGRRKQVGGRGRALAAAGTCDTCRARHSAELAEGRVGDPLATGCAMDLAVACRAGCLRRCVAGPRGPTCRVDGLLFAAMAFPRGCPSGIGNRHVADQHGLPPRRRRSREWRPHRPR